MRLQLIFLTLLIFLVSSNLVAAQPSLHSTSSAPDQKTPIVAAEIDREIFLKSVPRQMTAGQVYTVVAVVTNKGNVAVTFFVNLDLPYMEAMKFFSLLRTDVVASYNYTLEPGASARVESHLVPVSEHVGPLEIKATLYVTVPTTAIRPGTYVVADEVKAVVHEIRLPFSEEARVAILSLIVLAVVLTAVTAATRYLKKPSIRIDLLAALLLVIIAVSLRLPDLLLVGVYPDEMSLSYLSTQMLYYQWVWTKEMMESLVIYPPLFFYMQAALIYLFGYSLEVLRMMSVIFGSLNVVLVYLVGSSLVERKVGLLSGLLWAFFSYDILHGRIARTEAIVLFFILVSVYLFWKGYSGRSWKYMAASGVFLGLALNTKYIAMIPVGGFALFLIWIHGSPKALAKKRYLAWLVAFLAVIAPVQIDLAINGVNPYFNYYEIYVVERGAVAGYKPTTFSDAIYSGFMMLTYVLGRGGAPWLPWLSLLNFSIPILISIMAVYHGLPALKRKAEESFLSIMFLSMLIPDIAAGASARWYWLLYALPYFFIMLANFTFKTLQLLGSHHISPSITNGGVRRIALLRLIPLFLIAVFISSQVLTGVATPMVDKGEMEGLLSAMQFIKNRVQPGDVIASSNGKWGQYYEGLWNLNITEVSFTGYGAQYPFERVGHFQQDLMDKYKPKFIIMNRSTYDLYLNTDDELWLMERYVLVYVAKASIGYDWFPEQDWLVFQRVHY